MCVCVCGSLIAKLKKKPFISFFSLFLEYVQISSLHVDLRTSYYSRSGFFFRVLMGVHLDLLDLCWMAGNEPLREANTMRALALALA